MNEEECLNDFAVSANCILMRYIAVATAVKHDKALQLFCIISQEVICLHSLASLAPPSKRKPFPLYKQYQ